MKIQVRFAGYYRTLARQPSLELELAQGARVEDALVSLDEALEGRFREVFFAAPSQHSYPTFLTVVDTQLVDRDHVLQEGDILAIVPPMAGGER